MFPLDGIADTLPLMAEGLVINEIYLSLQGESTWAGLPCIFIRLTGCNLRCSYCDTAYAFSEGSRMSLEQILEKVKALAGAYSQPDAGMRLPLVELTGGEPLLQARTGDLMHSLCEEGFTVLLETSGAHDISQLDPRIHRIVDVKCPSSGESGRNRWANLTHLRATDEIKCVIATVEDYEWARGIVLEHKLIGKCPVLFSWAAPLAPAQQHPSLKPMPAQQTPLSRKELAERIIADALPVRFQVQMHKIIWPADQRGV